MKAISYFLISIILLTFSNKSMAQENLAGGDIFLHNLSTNNIWVRVYPISMVFNVNYLDVGNYDFHSRQHNLNFAYINGRGLFSETDGKHKLVSGETKSLNMEGVTSPGEAIAGIGRGVYKFEFFYETINNLVDSAIVEWDAGDFGDLSLSFDDERLPAKIVSYYFAGMSGPAPLPTNRRLNCWSYQNRVKDYGSWVFDDIEFQNLAWLPQDFREDCGVESHTAEDLENEWRIGILTLNMLIKKDNITTHIGQMLGAFKE